MGPAGEMHRARPGAVRRIRILGLRPSHVLIAFACLAPTRAALAVTSAEHAELSKTRAALEKVSAVTPPKSLTRLEPGMSASAVVDLRRLLAAHGITPAPTGPVELYDDALVPAVSAFQRRNMLVADATVGAKTWAALTRQPEEIRRRLDLALQRGAQDESGLRIVVNIPAMETRVYRDGEIILTSRAIVGRSDRSTPEFETKIERITFNPSWYVPPGIEKADIRPKLLHSTQVLAEKRLAVFDRTGRRVDPQTVDWTQNGYRFVQPPGPDNALGRIKFEMPNRHNVYLHDTPDRSLYARDMRMLSSGCVRVEQIDAIARLLIGEERWQRERIDERLASGRTFSVQLDAPVPARLVYDLADWVPETGLRLPPDIYGRLKAHALQS